MYMNDDPDCDYEYTCEQIRLRITRNMLILASLAVPDQPGGIFWAILNRTFISKSKSYSHGSATDRVQVLVILILLPTELVIPVKRLTQFYIDYIPIISPSHGLGILGVIQCWIASTVLSKYVHKFEQASGFLCFIVGCLNAIMVRRSDSLVAFA
jgi:hypothetical protein